MSDPGRSEVDDEDSVLAAEYVLGLIEGEDRARVAYRARRDPGFGAEVDVWERRFGAFHDSVASADPSAAVWEHIARSIEPRSNLISFPIRPKLWDRVGPWRVATAACLIAAACLAVIVVLPRPARAPLAPPIAPPVAVLIATLSTKGGQPLFVATADARTDAVTVIPVGVIEPGDRAPELWVIPVGGAPRPIGMIGAERPHALRASALVRSAVVAKAILAVSLEPPGGSPTGAPTGPVIATGVINVL